MSQKTKWQIKAGSFILLLLYIMILFYFCLISETYGRDQVANEYRYNLVPFREIMRFLTYWKVVGVKSVMLNMAGNIFAFLPYGLFVSISSVKKASAGLIIQKTFLLSLCIESIQLITRVGSFDVDDLILNTFGGFLGYLVYWVSLGFLRRKRFGKKNL